ncbi:MAG: hypothetical protein Q8T11_04190 [Elusimicrobiota bacterium]|nr:hypothetical protein [Elusimicrobiota bacterium]
MGLIAAAFVLLMSAPVLAGERVRVSDAGGFDPSGRTIEFPDRFGWTGYEAVFDFALDGDGRLSRSSRLSIAIVRRGGKRWKYSCRASADDLAARVVPLGPRTSVIAECRVKPKDFAKAVDLHPDDVGAPLFVFEAVLEGGRARAGGQRGLRFRPDAPVASLDLSPFAASPDAAGLAVVFRPE